MPPAFRRARVALASLALIAAAARCATTGVVCEPMGCPAPLTLRVQLFGRALVPGDAVRLSWIDRGVGFGITCTTNGCAQPTGGTAGTVDGAALVVTGPYAPPSPLEVTVSANGVELTKETRTRTTNVDDLRDAATIESRAAERRPCSARSAWARSRATGASNPAHACSRASGRSMSALAPASSWRANGERADNRLTDSGTAPATGRRTARRSLAA